MTKKISSVALSILLSSPLCYGAEFFPSTSEALTKEEVRSLAADSLGLGASEDGKIIVIDDMMFRPDTLLESGFSGRKWPNAEIFYQFDGNVTSKNQKRFLAACKVWNDVSAVKCTKRTSQPNFIHVVSGKYNRSYVGMIGGKQNLEIYNWRWKYIIAHELGHALGLSHEQSRSDRDTFVDIRFDNVRDEAEHNFKKRSTINHTPYDFRSVMHYGPTAFSKNGGPTITPQPGYEHEGQHMGNRSYLSAQDAAGMAAQYGPRR